MNARSMPVTNVPDRGSAPRTRPEDRYARITRLLAMDRCVILDGANGTELVKVDGERPETEEHLWGLTAIIESPQKARRRTAGISTSAAT